MNKEDILLNSYSVLSKNTKKNADALKSTILQLCQENSKLGLRCWLDLLKLNLNELQKGFGKEEFEYDNVGRSIVNEYEQSIVGNTSFMYSLHQFSESDELLEILYSKAPIDKYNPSIHYAIAFLIRNNRLQEADPILSAIYKNKAYRNYSDLWMNIVDRFQYDGLDNYCGGGFVDEKNYKQDSNIQNFCLRWVERITDDEDKAGAMAHIMRIM